MRYTISEKLRFVKMHLDDNVPIFEIHKKYGLQPSTLKYCCRLYLLHGEVPFQKSEKAQTYTREEKLKAIILVLEEKRSIRSVALDMMLTDPKIVKDWIKKYLNEGEAAIKDTFSRAAYLKHDDRLFVKEHQKLLEDLERTKAENEYLKKSLKLPRLVSLQIIKKDEVLLCQKKS